MNLVSACIGDVTNFDIFVDTASLNDGADVGLSLADSSTELKLILPNENESASLQQPMNDPSTARSTRLIHLRLRFVVRTGR